MLARPATMAAPPSTASPASWNPAVPPPPVTGASEGIGLGEGLGDWLSAGEALWLTDCDALDEALWLEALSLEALDEVPLLGVLLALGDNNDSDEEGVVDPVPVPAPDEVQAESATQASMVVRPQPTAVSLTRCAVPAMPVRALIGPPSCSRQ
jgi:hypothetical protein